jgi:lactate racemase
MKLSVPYNRKKIVIDLPENNFAGMIEPNGLTAAGSPEVLIRKALENCSGSLDYNGMIDGSGSLLVIVNDGTRPTPTRQVLDVIADDLAAADAKFIIATGVHRGPTEEEYRFIFGRHYDRFADAIYVHDARKDDEMVYLGTSGQGTEMHINRKGYEADKIIAIGSVEPHYFAGYTGGRKAILPGIASYRTIEQNHSHAISLDAQTLRLEGNPVHMDMVDALKTLKDKKIFSIMTVMDKLHSIYRVTAGDILVSFDDAVAAANDIFTTSIPRKADIVISCAGYPMDVDLYQAQKAIDNGKLALNEGGILILVSACREGVGESAYIELLSSCKTPAEVVNKIKASYRLGYHKAAKMAEISTWAQIWAKTELEGKLLESIFIQPVSDLQAAVDEALRQKGADAKVWILPDGAVTVPLVESDEKQSD